MNAEGQQILESVSDDMERLSVKQPVTEMQVVGDNLGDRYDLRFESYSSERQLPGVMRLITKDLSEPYSVYTYRYFLNQWPNLCFLTFTKTDELIGTIVCKLDEHRGKRRGYIAMLAVDDNYRRKGIGSALVEHSVDAMAETGCDEVVLETEVTNKVAMALYERLGFVADRRLFRYYLNGHDAFRLKLWLS